jgi:5-methyltetrahydropteroyltriglutamate--homocysteine methyltransferase
LKHFQEKWEPVFRPKMRPGTLSTPPFRAEHVGSLLRPRALRDARAAFARGDLDQTALTAAEDRAVAQAIALQQRVGLRLATDGEFRRASYHSYFYRQLGDISFGAPVADASGGRGAQPMAAVRSRIAWNGPIHAADHAFLCGRTTALPKITIPGPCALHFRGGDAAVRGAYRDVEEFWSDVIAAFRSELRALAAAGCRYVQIDETAFAKFGDPDVQAVLRGRGDDPDTLIDKYIDVTNQVLAGSGDLSIGMHLCRGNRAGQWHAEGSYEAVAEKLFNRLAIPFFFLEYDSARAGDFTPLRFVPKDKSIVLGLISTKTNFLEDKTELKRRIDAASGFVDVERLGVSPQCGFASTEVGNPISPEMQEAKLRLVVDLARETWGSA